MTLRGEQPPTRRHVALREWIRDGARLADNLYQAADSAGLDKLSRENIRLKLDGRNLSVETILATVKHHLLQEYPYLLRHETEHSLTALYASNLNDRYWITSLSQSDLITAKSVQQAAAALARHLENIPSQQPTAQSQ